MKFRLLLLLLPPLFLARALSRDANPALESRIIVVLAHSKRKQCMVEQFKVKFAARNFYLDWDRRSDIVERFGKLPQRGVYLCLELINGNVGLERIPCRLIR